MIIVDVNVIQITLSIHENKTNAYIYMKKSLVASNSQNKFLYHMYVDSKNMLVLPHTPWSIHKIKNFTFNKTTTEVWS